MVDRTYKLLRLARNYLDWLDTFEHVVIKTLMVDLFEPSLSSTD